MNKTGYRTMIILILLLIAALACNLPRRATPSPSGVVYTAAAQTLEAQLTLVAQPPVGSPGVTATLFLGLPSATPTSTSPVSTSPSATTQAVLPTSSATPRPCDLARFDKDVTYPDNSEVSPGQSFVKTWRLLNAGTCTWTTGYSVVFSGGDGMGAPAALPLPSDVAPGQTVDLSVTLTAPQQSGTYKGNFMLRNTSNVVFGLGDGSKPFWVQVKVVAATGLVYDFLSRARDASWFSGQGNDPAASLAYDGADDNPNGVAKIYDGITLENGTKSGKVLGTYPKRVDEGYVYGVFPAYTVQSGDSFKANLGFLIPSGATGCGAAKVKFQLSYKDGDAIKLLKEWSKGCDGKLPLVEFDLSSLAGKSVQLVLVVRADGASTDDWAVWNSARVQH